MLDSAGKRVAEQGQLQFLAERREWLDICDGCRQRIPRARRSHRKRAVMSPAAVSRWHDYQSACRCISPFRRNTMPR